MTMRDAWIAELRRVLARYGYPESAAEALYAEGCGPFELAERACIAGRGVGSLAYTHGIERTSP